MSRVVRVLCSPANPRVWVMHLSCGHRVTFTSHRTSRDTSRGRPTRRIHACEVCIVAHRKLVDDGAA